LVKKLLTFFARFEKKLHNNLQIVPILIVEGAKTKTGGAKRLSRFFLSAVGGCEGSEGLRKVG
jgi:hypothetical protein